MGYFRLDSNKLDQRALLLATSNGFEVTKQIIRTWLKQKHKTDIYVQPFGDHYIGVIIFDGKNTPLGDETQSYFKYKTEDDCFVSLIQRAFEIINRDFTS